MEKRGSSTIDYASYNLPTYIDAVSESSSLYYGAFRNRVIKHNEQARPILATLRHVFHSSFRRRLGLWKNNVAL